MHLYRLRKAQYCCPVGQRLEICCSARGPWRGPSASAAGGPASTPLALRAACEDMPGRPRLPLLLPIPGAPDVKRTAPDGGALVADLLIAPSGTCPAAAGA